MSDSTPPSVSSDAALAEMVIAAMERLIREEVVNLVGSGVNWKMTFNGSAAGDVRVVVERHRQISQRHFVLS